MLRFLFYLFVFSSLLLSSCEAQNDPEKKTPSETTSPSATSSLLPPSLRSEPVDPNFVEPEAIRSPYGPTAITRGVLEDRGGTIWLTTWHGIISYDGDTFVNHTYEENLPKWHAFASMEDSQGNLWFTTIGGGAYRYDGTTFKHFSTADGLPYDRVISIAEDKDGNIWFGTEEGLSRYDGENFHNFTTADGLPNHNINTIFQEENGPLWIGNRGPLLTYDGHSFTPVTDGKGGQFINVWSVGTDPRGNVWWGGNDGLWRDDLTRVDSNFVGTLYFDRAGNLYTSASATNSNNWSLLRYPTTELSSISPQPTVISEGHRMLFGIEEDRVGGIWFGSLNGVGRYNGREVDFFRKD